MLLSVWTALKSLSLAAPAVQERASRALMSLGQILEEGAAQDATVLLAAGAAAAGQGATAGPIAVGRQLPHRWDPWKPISFPWYRRLAASWISFPLFPACSSFYQPNY